LTAALSTQHVSIRTLFSGTTATVVVSGELDFCNKHALRRALADVLEQRPEQLVLDLTDVTFMDCAAARVLAAGSRVLPGDRQAVIRRPSRAVRRLLDVTGMSAGFWFDYSLPRKTFQSATPAAPAWTAARAAEHRVADRGQL
jgi:anti-anti-sigma factor